MVGAFLQQVGRLVEDRGALFDLGRAPQRPGALGGGERFLEVGGGGQRHLGDATGGDGIDDGVGIAAFAALPVAVDEQLQLCVIAHVRPDRRGHACRQPVSPLERFSIETGAISMTKAELAAKMQDAGAVLPGKTVKLDFGDQGTIMLDGNANTVTEDDGAADTTIKIAWADWEAMTDGPTRRHDRLHDRQVEGRGRHVQRDAAAGRAAKSATRREGGSMARLAGQEKSIPTPPPPSTGCCSTA